MFQEVLAGFLPVANTQADIDQDFSRRDPQRLRTHNVITLEELHYQLRETFSGKCYITYLKRVANRLGLCDAELCICFVEQMIQYSYCKFTQSSDTSENPLQVFVKYTVKCTCEEKCQSMSANNESI